MFEGPKNGTQVRSEEWNFTTKKRDKDHPQTNRISWDWYMFIPYRPTFYLPSININLVDFYGYHSCR